MHWCYSRCLHTNMFNSALLNNSAIKYIMLRFMSPVLPNELDYRICLTSPFGFFSFFVFFSFFFSSKQHRNDFTQNQILIWRPDLPKKDIGDSKLWAFWKLNPLLFLEQSPNFYIPRRLIQNALTNFAKRSISDAWQVSEYAYTARI